MDYTDLDKSRQFLEGLDGDEYDTERTLLTAIIDGVELNNTVLQPKHRLNCLASTIMNMKNKHNSSKVQINAFSKARTYQKGTNQYNSTSTRIDSSNHRKYHYDINRGTGFQFKTTHDQDKLKKYSFRSPATPKFSKGQCAACKIYGHHIKDCRFIAPHIAMENFVKQNPQVCTEILNSHIANNTVEHKRTIVRTMQTMGIFDEDTDSDNYLDNEEIVDTPVVNKIIDLTGSDTDNPTDISNVQINMINTNHHIIKDISSRLSDQKK